MMVCVWVSAADESWRAGERTRARTHYFHPRGKCAAGARQIWENSLCELHSSARKLKSAGRGLHTWRYSNFASNSANIKCTSLFAWFPCKLELDFTAKTFEKPFNPLGTQIENALEQSENMRVQHYWDAFWIKDRTIFIASRASPNYFRAFTFNYQ